jgi:AraC-like DNA-binding protein
MTATVRVSGLRGFASIASELGGDPGQLTRDCGIDPHTLDNEGALLPYRQVIHLMEHCATKLDVPDFGLRLAAIQDIGILGPLAVAIQNSATVEEAIRCAASHLFLQSPALRLETNEQGCQTSIRLDIRLNNMPHQGMRQAEDLAIALAHRFLSMLAADSYHLIKVELPHEPLCSPAIYEQYFGAPVHFGCPTNAVYVGTTTLSTPLSGRNAQLHELAVAYLDVQVPTPDGLVATRVETAIRRTLGTDSCNRTAVARAMAMHPRTLYRRLEREGVTFDEVRDGVRREKAEYYLSKTNAPLSQVAGIIGYSEQSILTRSCQRWFGQTPRKFRAAHSQE